MRNPVTKAGRKRPTRTGPPGKRKVAKLKAALGLIGSASKKRRGPRTRMEKVLARTG